MTVSRRRRLRSSRAGARLVLSAILGELLGAVVGLVVAPRRHVGATVEITKPSYGNASDTSDTEDSDPLVAWPLLGVSRPRLPRITLARADPRAFCNSVGNGPVAVTTRMFTRAVPLL